MKRFELRVWGAELAGLVGRRALLRICGLILLIAFGSQSSGFAQEGVAVAGDVADESEETDSDNSGDWEFILAPYGYLPWVDVTSLGGTDINLDLGEILEALKMTIMVDMEVRKGRWGFSTDLIYVNLEGALDGRVFKTIDLKEWIVMPRLSYRILEGDWGHFDVFGGARYTDIEMNLSATLFGDPRTVVGEFHVWDYMGGVRGSNRINDDWSFGYYGELGAGDSDLIGQAAVELTRHLKSNLDMYFQFRYVYYDWGNVPLDNENVYGPQIGMRMRF